MSEGRDKGYITLRVSAEEKKHFEDMASNANMTVAALLRYELQNHYSEVERRTLIRDLKALVTSAEKNNAIAERQEMLKQLMISCQMTSKWMAGKIKHYNREITRLERLLNNSRELEQKAISILEGAEEQG